MAAIDNAQAWLVVFAADHRGRTADHHHQRHPPQRRRRASGRDEITHNIAEVARAAQSTTSGASDTQAAALELARMASAPQELVGRFRC